MKIEIELKDLEDLKHDMIYLKNKNEKLEEQLNNVNEKAIKKQITKLARKMFSSVMKKVFKDLGFSDITNLNDIDFYKLENYIGEDWYNSNDIKVELGANITNNFAGAFLKMGIKK